MGVEDREWYREQRRRRERLHYDPKSFRRSRTDDDAGPRRARPGFATFTAIALVLALAAAPSVGRWLQRLASTSSGGTSSPPASAKPG